MLRHQHESRAQQTNEKNHGLESPKHDRMFFEGNVILKSETAHKQVAVDENTIRLLAYQIYCRKGGSAIDNWLTAETFLKNKNRAFFTFEN